MNAAQQQYRVILANRPMRAARYRGTPAQWAAVDVGHIAIDFEPVCMRGCGKNRAKVFGTKLV